MKKVASSESLITINHYKNILESEDITCEIRNEHLGGIVGEMPFVEVWPELWVKHDLDADRAKQLIDEANSDESQEPSWKCRRCGEDNEGQFAACWNCGENL
ncbi:MAG: DUF2007 domain-containing protein [Proteobacteria bacterium]|nr:DUF2007 domain-containing protein [Pseudomonadota bacterium]